MNFRTKQAVDFWAGGLLLLLLVLPVRALGLLLRREHSLERRKGCAVMKLVGAGSLFLAMPSLQAIRGQFPDGKFFLVGTPAVIGFAKPFGWFDAYWEIDDSGLVRLAVTSLRTLLRIAWHSDHLIDLEVHSRLTTVFGIFSAVRNRIGFVNDIVSWRRAFYTHMTYFNVQGPVYAFYDLLAAWFGIERIDAQGFHERFRAQVGQTELPPGLTLPRRYVVLGPGCSPLGKERELRPEEWRQVAERGHAAVVVLGGKADAALGEAVLGALGDGVNLCGQLTLRQSTKVLAGAEIYYGIDSLLLHLARALGVASVSVWGPSKPATRLRPADMADTMFFAQMACSPCIHVHETPPCRGMRSCIPAALATPPNRMGPVRAKEAGIAIGWASGPTGQVREVRVRYD